MEYLVLLLCYKQRQNDAMRASDRPGSGTERADAPAMAAKHGADAICSRHGIVCRLGTSKK